MAHLLCRYPASLFTGGWLACTVMLATHQEVCAACLAQERSCCLYALGLRPVWRRNSRLKLDLVKKPQSSMTVVTGASPEASCSHAAAIRKPLIHCAMFFPHCRLTMADNSRAGTPMRRASLIRLKSGSLYSPCACTKSVSCSNMASSFRGETMAARTRL